MLSPLRNQILVELDDQEENIKNGIYIPDTSKKEKPQTGIVVAVGPGRITAKGVQVKPDICPGDRILFNKYAGSEVVYEKQTYLILNDQDILAYIQ